MSRDGLIVKRWTRYGQDRLYVSTETGERVGWFDLVTGRATVECSELEQSFLCVALSQRAAEAPATFPKRQT